MTIRVMRKSIQKTPERPDHCTRRRMKPFIDDCECEYCKAINESWSKPATIEAGYGCIPIGTAVGFLDHWAAKESKRDKLTVKDGNHTDWDYKNPSDGNKRYWDRTLFRGDEPVALYFLTFIEDDE